MCWMLDASISSDDCKGYYDEFKCCSSVMSSSVTISELCSSWLLGSDR